MSIHRGLRAWLLAGIVALAVVGGLIGSQAVPSASHGTTTHQLADTPPIWPPAI